MTEEERYEAFNNEDNWTPSVEYPSNGFIRVLTFEFYSVTFYRLQIYTNLFNIGDGIVTDWSTKFNFVRRNDHIEVVADSEAYDLMKQAEKKEMES